MSSKESEALQTPAGDTTTAEAPAQLLELPRNLITRSKTNPRTHFDEAYLKDLAASIREHGILQPILVRPLPITRLQDTFEDRQPGEPLPTHEIVCGECRWRASGLAEVDQLPVLVRHLTDLQVLQVQLVENLKRRDLHPLEEAEGFDRLMKDHHLTVEDIAARVDKSASQIYVTLKLLELTPECRQQLYAGKLTRSTALLVARAPAYLQVDIAKDIMAPTGFDQEPMSYRQAQRHIQQHYMLQLANAVFDIKDASLVAKAGSCGTCAKNTGANADMFEDVKGGDTCTDPKCFDAKKVAHFDQVAKAAAAKGQKVIQGKEAKEIIPYQHATPTGYVLLDHQTYINGKHTTLRKALGKDGPVPVLIINPHTKEAQEALPTDVADKLVKKAGAKAKAAKNDAEPNKQDLERQFAEAWQDKAIEQIHAAVWAGKGQGITVPIARHIAISLANGALYNETAARFARLFDVPAARVATRDGVEEFLKTCPDSTVGPALLMLLLEDEIDTKFYGGNSGELEAMQLLATDTGVDLQAVQEQVKADMRAAAEERKAAAEAKAGKEKKPAPAGKAKKTSAAEASAAIADALQTADFTDVRPQPGEKVKFKQDLRYLGKMHKVAGLSGTVASKTGDRAYLVNYGSGKGIIADYTELERLAAGGDSPTPTPAPIKTTAKKAAKKPVSEKPSAGGDGPVDSTSAWPFPTVQR